MIYIIDTMRPPAAPTPPKRIFPKPLPCKTCGHAKRYHDLHMGAEFQGCRWPEYGAGRPPCDCELYQP